ncbi:integumentary mucin A.1-like isoform X2 [Helicoverpa zea]|uniref:integumentary mucin A.1-like isoform X2 n=1 Tax=Helicoverpa zea TaxID=7113 RepID=UPI001F5ADEAA|nr:integumentary mucin A.1-like isoform X2 [Helicoverpa zea]
MLVDYMSTHTLFANGEYRGPLGKEGHNEEWVRIQQLLKEYGPNKTVEQWRTITSLPSAFPSPPLPTTSNSPIPTTSVADQPSVPTTTTQPSVPTTRTQPPIPTTTTQPSVPTTRTQPPIPTTTMQPSVVPTTTTQSTRVQRAQRVKNEFLASDAETREVLLDISNSLKRKNYIEENQMRRNHLDR